MPKSNKGGNKDASKIKDEQFRENSKKGGKTSQEGGRKSHNTHN